MRLRPRSVGNFLDAPGPRNVRRGPHWISQRNQSERRDPRRGSSSPNHSRAADPLSKSRSLRWPRVQGARSAAKQEALLARGRNSRRS